MALLHSAPPPGFPKAFLLFFSFLIRSFVCLAIILLPFHLRLACVCSRAFGNTSVDVSSPLSPPPPPSATLPVFFPPPLLSPPLRSDTTQQQKGRRRQHVVVVREDWSVICFDHELVKVWKEPLEHAGSPAEGSSFLIDQVRRRKTQQDSTEYPNGSSTQYSTRTVPVQYQYGKSTIPGTVPQYSTTSK